MVDVYVRYLRRKLGEGIIETVRGMGYRSAAEQFAAQMRDLSSGPHGAAIPVRAR